MSVRITAKPTLAGRILKVLKEKFVVINVKVMNHPTDFGERPKQIISLDIVEG